MIAVDPELSKLEAHRTFDETVILEIMIREKLLEYFLAECLHCKNAWLLIIRK